MSAQKLSGEIGRIVQAKLAADKLVLPTMPQAAMECSKILQDPNFTTKQLSRWLERDPLLAAQVVRASNAAAYGGSGSIKNLEQAVNRIGSARLKTLLFELSARKLFQSSHARIAESSKRVWEHSVAVALLARDVAALVDRNEDADVCYLIGLLHDVGKPIVASVLLEAERSLGDKKGWIDPETWNQTVESTHRPVGVALAQKWQLPEVVASAIGDIANYSDDRQSAANITRFANAVAKLEGFQTGPFDTQEVEALVMIGRSMLGISEEVVTRLATGLADRVSQHT